MEDKKLSKSVLKQLQQVFSQALFKYRKADKYEIVKKTALYYCLFFMLIEFTIYLIF